jgi:hypothetical protein
MISKQQNMLVWGVAKSTHPNTTTSFPYATSDNALKSHRGLLESHVHKHNHLKERIIRHGRI